MDGGTDLLMSIDLRDVERPRRARQWRASLDSLYLPMTYNIPDSFQLGRMRGIGFDGISVGHIMADPIMAARSKSHLARYPLDAYVVVLSGGCGIVLTQGSRTVRLERNSFTVVSTAEASTFHQLDPGLHQSVLIPGELMRRHAPGIDNNTALSFKHALLHDMFYTMATEWAAEAHRLVPAARGLVAQSMVRLLGLTLDGADDRSAESVIRQARRRPAGPVERAPH